MEIPWTEEPGRLQSTGSLESDTTERLHFHFSLSCIGEGNGNPLQCSFLENPKDGEAWWAAVYGVAQSRTRLKRLSKQAHLLWAFKVLFQELCLSVCTYGTKPSKNLTREYQTRSIYRSLNCIIQQLSQECFQPPSLKL